MNQTYWFDGVPRLRLFFATPNQLGLFATVVYFCLLGLLLRSHERSAGMRVYRILLWASLCILPAVIAMTFSRGAHVAAAAGAVLMFWLCVRQRKLLMLALSIFVVVSACLPHSGKRLSGIATGWDDSVYNRLRVWRGALAASWDSCPRGLGRTGFRDVFEAWYQAGESNGVYGHPVSDYLNIAVTYGLPALVAFLFLAGGGLYSACWFCRRTNREDFAGLCAALLALLVGIQFSTFFFSTWFVILSAGLYFVLAVVIFRSFRTVSREEVRRLGSASAAFGGVLSCLAIVLAYASAHQYSHRPLLERGSMQSQQRLVAGPRNGNICGRILVLSETWYPVDDARRFVRALAASGFEVTSLMLREQGARGVDKVNAEVSAWIGDDETRSGIILRGGVSRAALAALAGLRPLRRCWVALVDSPAWFAVTEFSPEENIGRLECPLLLVATDQKSVGALGVLSRRASEGGREVTTVTLGSQLAAQAGDLSDVATRIACFHSSCQSHSP